MGIRRLFLSGVLTFSMVTANAQNLCMALFPQDKVSLKMQERVKVQTISEEGSQLHVRYKEFSSDPEKAFKDVLFHLASTRVLTLSKKNYLKYRDGKEEMILGFDIGHGYYAEVTYRSAGESMMGKSMIIVTPSNRERVVFENMFELAEARPRQIETYDLSNLYPNSKSIRIEIPTLISGDVMVKLRQFEKRFEYLEKSEIKQLVSEDTGSATIEEIAQKRYSKKQFLHYWGLAKYKAIVKIPFKILWNTAVGITFFAVTFTDLGPSVKDYVFPDKKEWVQQSVVQFQDKLPVELRAEANKLADLAIGSVKQAQPQIRDMMDTKPFKISSTQYMWLVQSKNEQGLPQTYFVAYHTIDKAGAAEFWSIAINEAQFPGLVKHMKKSGHYLKAE